MVTAVQSTDLRREENVKSMNLLSSESHSNLSRTNDQKNYNLSGSRKEAKSITQKLTHSTGPSRNHSSNGTIDKTGCSNREESRQHAVRKVRASNSRRRHDGMCDATTTKRTTISSVPHRAGGGRVNNSNPSRGMVVQRPGSTSTTHRTSTVRQNGGVPRVGGGGADTRQPATISNEYRPATTRDQGKNTKTSKSRPGLSIPTKKVVPTAVQSGGHKTAPLGRCGRPPNAGPVKVPCGPRTVSTKLVTRVNHRIDADRTDARCRNPTRNTLMAKPKQKSESANASPSRAAPLKKIGALEKKLRVKRTPPAAVGIALGRHMAVAVVKSQRPPKPKVQKQPPLVAKFGGKVPKPSAKASNNNDVPLGRMKYPPNRKAIPSPYGPYGSVPRGAERSVPSRQPLRPLNRPPQPFHKMLHDISTLYSDDDDFVVDDDEVDLVESQKVLRSELKDIFKNYNPKKWSKIDREHGDVHVSNSEQITKEEIMGQRINQMEEAQALADDAEGEESYEEYEDDNPDEDSFIDDY